MLAQEMYSGLQIELLKSFDTSKKFQATMLKIPKRRLITEQRAQTSYTEL